MIDKEIEARKTKFDTIRKEWNEKEEKWYFSIVDLVSVTTPSNNPRNYWKVLKNRLNTKQNKLVTLCNQLKLKASDGKFYLTDVGEIDVITEILKLISPHNLLPFKAWALGLGKPKEEISAPRIGIKIGNEISFKNKIPSYPQVTYNLAKLLNKNSNTPVIEVEEKIPKKVFKKVSRMGTI